MKHQAISLVRERRHRQHRQRRARAVCPAQVIGYRDRITGVVGVIDVSKSERSSRRARDRRPILHPLIRERHAALGDDGEGCGAARRVSARSRLLDEEWRGGAAKSANQIKVVHLVRR